MEKTKHYQSSVVVLTTAMVMLAFLLFVTNANAQVTIGTNTPPDKFSLLDLNTSSNKKALHLPRLTTTERNALVTSASSAGDQTLAVGVHIYNTTTGCLDTWNGTDWMTYCGTEIPAPKITSQPRAFNWTETTGGTLTGIGGESATISITAVGDGLSYQWYQVPKNLNATVLNPAPGTSNSNVYTPPVSALGMREYFCVVSNAFGSVESNRAKVAVGCGGLTTSGGWLGLMCYNLGATATTLNAQMTTGGNIYYNGAAGDLAGAGTASGQLAYSAVYGDLYQWGRIGDGHEKRNSAYSATNGPYPDASGLTPDQSYAAGGWQQIPSTQTNWYGRFIKAPVSPYNWHGETNADLLWRNYRFTQNDPCATLGAPAGVNWRVPNQNEWGELFKGGQTSGASGIASSNTWVWRAASTPTNGSYGTSGGYELRPDGQTTTLFLPAAGYRHASTGQLNGPSVNGGYWSSTNAGTAAYTLDFRISSVVPSTSTNRAHGFSVRCIGEL